MTLSVATEFTIDANGTQTVAVARINSTQSIVLYRDTVAGDYEARVVEVDEDIGAAETIESNANSSSANADVCILSGTKAIVAYGAVIAGAIRVAVVTISGTNLTLVGASVINISNSQDGSNSVRLAAMSTGAFVATHQDSNVGYATYFTVSGNTITEESQTTFDGAINNASLISLSSSVKALVAYTDNDDSDILKMCVLSISGSTISAGTPVNIEANDIGSSGENGDTALAEIDSSTALLAYANHTDEELKAVVISIAGTVPSANTPVTVDTWNSGAGESIRSLALIDFSVTQMALSYNESNAGTSSIAELFISGTNVTDQGSISLTADDTVGSRAVMFSSTKGIVVYEGTAKGVIITASPTSVDQLDIAPMRKPADIDSDGVYVYIGALNNSGNPVLVKILTDLSMDGELVFNPGGGDNIGVQCGKYDSAVLWIAGAFDGTNVVEESEDAAGSFAVKDPATFGGITTFAIGPDSDDRVLVIDGNEDIHETIDAGGAWITLNTAVGLASLALARLAQNVQEMVIGNEPSATNNIQYTINSGIDLEDYSSGFPEAEVSGVIVG